MQVSSSAGGVVQREKCLIAARRRQMIACCVARSTARHDGSLVLAPQVRSQTESSPPSSWWIGVVSASKLIQRSVLRLQRGQKGITMRQTRHWKSLTMLFLAAVGLALQAAGAAAINLNVFTDPYTIPGLAPNGTIGFAYAGNKFVG